MNALIVADDLTGAMDTGHQFAASGLETTVRISRRPPDADENVDARWQHEGDTDRQTPTATAAVVAVTTETRYADAPTARERVVRAVSVADADESTLVYKKVDSTLRGNVVAELEATIDATDAALAVVAPAFPAAGRVTRDGIHTVDGVPLSETEYADDENGPTTAHLPTLLAASRYPVDHVPLEDVSNGVEALAAVVRDAAGREGARVLSFDATRSSHLAAIADAAARCDERVVYAGSGGLARYVTVPGDGRETDARRGRKLASAPNTTRKTGALGIVGSVNDRTLAQLDRVPDATVIALEPSDVLESPTTAGQEAGTRAGKRLAAGEIAVLTGARSNPDLEETLEIGRREGLDRSQVRVRVKRALARAGRAAVDVQPPAGLFSTGGDVTVAVCEALEASSVALTGEEIEDGIPVGRLETGPIAGTTIVTKAGGFGGESAIVNSLSRLREDDRQ
ncbi:four-carbon acid sugar kinase family protein [Halobacteria archaeon AArc-m2/3/4]|uniref:Four-carbon acid sugar kinase family protein n=1 Tax=Natronoglomus mannanivorans TaxID=2979990 RepID=A0ABT2QDQ0_9EURY|nr:four-carbon acid sugar kinase family protein [Halobacteria archaeon AArc-m2/3/4]